MPAIVDSTQVGKREFRMGVIFLADANDTPFLSAAKKPASSYKGEKSGLPQMLGTYQLKTRGARKAGGVADGKDVSNYDGDPPRDEVVFRAEKYWRHPMVGDIAEGNDIAGIKSEMAEAEANQTVNLKRDMDTELLGDQDSSANGGLEGGSTTRGLGRWVNNVAATHGLAYTDANAPVPLGIQTPLLQIYDGAIGADINAGLTEAVLRGLLKGRWGYTGDNGQLMGFCGSLIVDKISQFSTYTPNVTNATVTVRTERDGFGTGTFMSNYVDVYKSGPYGAFTIMPVPSVTENASGTGLPDAYRAYFLDMSQVEVRSRYWFREKQLPDLGGGPRKEIACLIALIAGDPRSHVKIAATAS